MPNFLSLDDEGRYRRKNLLAVLERKVEIASAWRLLGDDFFDIDNLFMEQSCRHLYNIADDKRYTQRGPYRKNDLATYCEKHLDESSGCWLKPDEFRAVYRVDKNEFWILHEKIRQHPIFRKPAGRGRKQFPSKYQLMMYLAYVGTEGNGMSQRRGRALFPCGSGICLRSKSGASD